MTSPPLEDFKMTKQVRPQVTFESEASSLTERIPLCYMRETTDGSSVSGSSLKLLNFSIGNGDRVKGS